MRRDDEFVWVWEKSDATICLQYQRRIGQKVRRGRHSPDLVSVTADSIPDLLLTVRRPTQSPARSGFEALP